MGNKIRVLVHDPSAGNAVAEIDNDLQALYDTIGCQYIEVATRWINGTAYDVICDEEGRLKDLDASAWQVGPGGMGLRHDMVGRLILCHHDENGDFTGLTNGDITLINSRTILCPWGSILLTDAL